MKLSIKKLAVAVALAATAASASAIDNGQTGNGGLFVNVWDANGSYTFDLGITMDSLLSSIADAGNLNLSYSDPSGLFQSFLSGTVGGTRSGTLKFNTLAVDTFEEDGSDLRIFATYGNTADINTLKKNQGVSYTSAGANVSSFVTKFNTAAGDAVSIAQKSSDPLYTQKSSTYKLSNLRDKSFDTSGTYADAGTYASGLNLMVMSFVGGDTEMATYTQLTDNGQAVRLWVDADSSFHIAAVPEPESYAMLLAGLGMVGFMARRRLGKHA